LRTFLLIIAVAGLAYIGYYIALFLPGEYKQRKLVRKSETTNNEIILPSEETTPSPTADTKVELNTSTSREIQPSLDQQQITGTLETELQKRLDRQSTELGTAEMSLVQNNSDRIVFVIDNFFRDPNLSAANYLLLSKLLLANASSSAINILVNQLQNNPSSRPNIAEGFLQSPVVPLSEDSRRLAFTSFIELAADNSDTIFIATAAKLVETLSSDDRRSWFEAALETLIRSYDEDPDNDNNPLLALITKMVQENEFYQELLSSAAERIPEDAPFRVKLLESAKPSSPPNNDNLDEEEEIPEEEPSSNDNIDQEERSAQ
jgi:hypothetical protein